jgi:4-amino-4-deoxy-L-arabinose transferase-like glycosyltransferase
MAPQQTVSLWYKLGLAFAQIATYITILWLAYHWHNPRWSMFQFGICLIVLTIFALIVLITTDKAEGDLDVVIAVSTILWGIVGTLRAKGELQQLAEWVLVVGLLLALAVGIRKGISQQVNRYRLHGALSRPNPRTERPHRSSRCRAVVEPVSARIKQLTVRENAISLYRGRTFTVGRRWPGDRSTGMIYKIMPSEDGYTVYWGYDRAGQETIFVPSEHVEPGSIIMED